MSHVKKILDHNTYNATHCSYLRKCLFSVIGITAGEAKMNQDFTSGRRVYINLRIQQLLGFL